MMLRQTGCNGLARLRGIRVIPVLLFCSATVAAQAAPEAGQQGEPEPTSPVSSLESTAPETLDLLTELEILEQNWARKAQQDPPELIDLRATNQKYREQLSSENPQASEVLRQSLSILDRYFDLLEELLETYSSPSEVDLLLERLDEAPPDPEGLSFGAASKPRRRPLSPEETAAAKRMRSIERQMRWNSLLDHGREVIKLNRLRIEALDSLSDRQRLSIYSLSAQGLQHLEIELRMLRLSLFGFAKSRFDQSTNLPRLANDLVAAGTFGLVLGRLSLVLLGWYLLSRWRTSRLEEQGRAARTAAGHWLKSDGRWVVHLAGLLCLRWALGPAADWPVVGIVLQCMVIYVLYRAALDILITVLGFLGRQSTTSFAALYRERLFVSVRWVVRVAAFFWLLRWIVSSRIGEAVTYSALGWLRTMIVLIVAVIVSVPWREDLEDAYLRDAPVGLLIPWVKRNRKSKKGLLALPYILLWFSIQTLVTSIRDLLMRFGQSRRAVAFLFRRRIERQAGRAGYAEVEISDLPEDLVSALDDSITAEDLNRQGILQGLERAFEAVESWSYGDSVGALILAGANGMGKKAWLDRFVEEAPGDTVRLTLHERLLDEDALLSSLAENLLADAGLATSLVERLLDGPKRVVIVEHGEHLFLTRIDGYKAVEGLATLIEETHRNVFWVVSFGALAWRHLQASGASLASLGFTVKLAPWTEEEIRGLLADRIAQTPYSVSWSELATVGMHEVHDTDLASAKAGFSRLLWDYAAGNPSIALHFFLRSLFPIGDGILSVRLFKFPSETRLLELGDSSLFLLARVLVHGSLELSEASSTIVTSGRRTRILARGLENLGTLQRRGSEFSVPLHWYAASKRLLKRQNLLMS